MKCASDNFDDYFARATILKSIPTSFFTLTVRRGATGSMPKERWPRVAGRSR
jgi:hypothetical protein